MSYRNFDINDPEALENVWRRRERQLARKERPRLIRLGRIVPERFSQPQMMVKNSDGTWSPELKIHATA